MTHKELIEVAYKWVLKRGGCGIAFKELKSTAKEIPDVIGFDHWHSIIIECKVSKSDFFKDKYKKHRNRGMGVFRFFCCPADIIKIEDLPEKWGLIYVDENRNYRVVKEVRREQRPDYDHEKETGSYHTDRYTNAFDNDREAEQRLLYSVVRRLFIKGHVKHIYDKKYDKYTTPDELILLNNTEKNA